MQQYPDPKVIYPTAGITRTCFLKNIITNAQIIIGDYTYYDDPVDVNNFEKNVLYLFDFIGDKLIIGKFCQIATGVKFIMNGGNHATNGLSTYPFKIFGHAWAEAELNPPVKGDTLIGNDVWIGNSVTIMPGITIGDGAIVASCSVVTKNVAPYTVVGGNPSQVIRSRFNEDVVQRLINLQWWNWPIEKISKNLSALTNGNIDELEIT